MNSCKKNYKNINNNYNVNVIIIPTESKGMSGTRYRQELYVDSCDNCTPYYLVISTYRTIIRIRNNNIILLYLPIVDYFETTRKSEHFSADPCAKRPNFFVIST